jgi:ATP-dependent Zn protease
VYAFAFGADGATIGSDAAVRELLLRAEGRATELVRTHRPRLQELVRRLEREETLYREDIESCLKPQPPRQRGIAGQSFLGEGS